MFEKTYRVRAAVGGHEKDSKVTAKDFPAGTNLEALVGVFLDVDGIESDSCPACVEQKAKRIPKFDDLEKLRSHYAEKHAGLVPPGEEE